MHSLVTNRVHVIFSTKDRRKLIPEAMQPRLWAFMGGIARRNEFVALAVGGTDNHAHALIAIPPKMPLAKAVQLIKGGSSKWCNQNLNTRFAWQEGYAAFSVSTSHKQSVVEYIRNQKRHHERRSFEQELIAFLKKHEVPFNAAELFAESSTVLTD
jgi:putative transposase